MKIEVVSKNEIRQHRKGKWKDLFNEILTQEEMLENNQAIKVKLENSKQAFVARIGLLKCIHEYGKNWEVTMRQEYIFVTKKGGE